MVVLISNGNTFVDITDLIPALIKSWGGGTEDEAINAFMIDMECPYCAVGKTQQEAATRLIRGEYYREIY